MLVLAAGLLQLTTLVAIAATDILVPAADTLLVPHCYSRHPKEKPAVSGFEAEEHVTLSQCYQKCDTIGAKCAGFTQLDAAVSYTQQYPALRLRLRLPAWLDSNGCAHPLLLPPYFAPRRAPPRAPRFAFTTPAPRGSRWRGGAPPPPPRPAPARRRRQRTRIN
jgi:hypothetical protein